MNQAEETTAFAGGTHGDSIDPAHDWEVTLSPAFGIGPDGLVEVPGRNVVMAGGRAIDVVGSAARDTPKVRQTDLCPSLPDQSARWHDLEQYPTEEHPAQTRILCVDDGPAPHR